MAPVFASYRRMRPAAPSRTKSSLEVSSDDVLRISVGERGVVGVSNCMVLAVPRKYDRIPEASAMKTASLTANVAPGSIETGSLNHGVAEPKPPSTRGYRKSMSSVWLSA